MQPKIQPLIAHITTILFLVILCLIGDKPSLVAQSAQPTGEIADAEAPSVDWVSNLADEDLYTDAATEEFEAEEMGANRLYLPLVTAALPMPTMVNAAAHTLLVTKLTDTNDQRCNHDCSLREATEAAAATPEVDTISLPRGVYQLALGPLVLSSAHLQGVDSGQSIIDGAHRSSVITTVGGDVIIQRVTIRHGKGHGIHHTSGNLTIVDSVVTANQTLADECGGGIRSGGENYRELTIRNSHITNNRAWYGGGLCLSAITAQLFNSTIDGNQARGDGGGFYVFEGGATLFHTTISNNRAGENGGGYTSRTGVSTFEQSAFFANQALNGGALWTDESEVRLRNSTISGNRARNNGGGILNEALTYITLEHVTVAFNVADSDQKAGGDGGGIFHTEEQLTGITMRNTVIGKNRDKSGPAHDCVGVITAEAYNLVQNTAGCVLTGALTSLITGVDPKLGPLGLHGGQTKNHLPRSNSPVVDVIPSDTCPSSLDQRGVSRPQDGNNDGEQHCDIGATERKPARQ